MNQSFYLHAQDSNGGECKNLYRTSKKVELSNEGSSQIRSIEMVKCRLHLCNLRQPLGEPTSCSSKDERIHCDKK